MKKETKVDAIAAGRALLKRCYNLTRFKILCKIERKNRNFTADYHSNFALRNRYDRAKPTPPPKKEKRSSPSQITGELLEAYD